MLVISVIISVKNVIIRKSSESVIIVVFVNLQYQYNKNIKKLAKSVASVSKKYQ